MESPVLCPAPGTGLMGQRHQESLLVTVVIMLKRCSGPTGGQVMMCNQGTWMLGWDYLRK